MPVLVIGNKNYSSWSLRPWLLLRQFNAFEERYSRWTRRPSMTRSAAGRPAGGAGAA
jgi:hypothetical protein